MEYPLEACVLGPLRLTMGEKDATPSAQKQRQVLATLLVNHPQVVPVSSLFEELWEGDPPRSALTTVQTYVLGIRKRLAEKLHIKPEDVAADLLQTRSKGYFFNAQSCVFDLHQYRGLVEAGKEALQRGDDRGGVRLLRAADDLWRGPVLVDVVRGLPLEVEAAQLEQSRLLILELRVEAELRLGLHREVCADLAGLVMRYPYHERLHAYFMFSLCRAGWRARALEVFHKLRNSMIDELGLEPCAKVQQLHRHILAASEDSVDAVLSRNHAGYLKGIFETEGRVVSGVREAIPASRRAAWSGPGHIEHAPSSWP